MSGGVTVDGKRLAKLLGMLGSDHDGEIAAAGRAADRLVREAGLTWRQVILTAPDRALPPMPLDETLRFCWRNSEHLTMWERGFLSSLHRQKRISDKQAEILDQIIEKLQRGARAA